MNSRVTALNHPRPRPGSREHDRPSFRTPAAPRARRGGWRIVALDLRGTLEDLGYAVIGTAASSDEALRVADERRPDLVLMNIRISGVSDGIQTARLLRARYHLPVVYLTANADADTLERALATEPAGYLVKPYKQTAPYG
ncbi:MAG TPA: response regulator [Kofleriaceae bacterium]|nr:response regulator [Kofleriaceae bacterium]